MSNGYKGPVKKRKKGSGRAAILDLVDKEWGKSDSAMYQRSDKGGTKVGAKSDKPGRRMDKDREPIKPKPKESPVSTIKKDDRFEETKKPVKKGYKP